MFGGFQVGPFQLAYQQSAVVASTGAGRRKRRRKYVVEIDGEEFIVDSEQQAMALLDRAKALAQQAARAKADEVVEKVMPRAMRIGKTRKIILKPPTISGSSALSEEIRQEQAAIRQIYLDAAVAAELRLLLLLQQMQDDEETIILLMN